MPAASGVDRHPRAQAQGGWLCSQLHCDLPAAPSTPAPHSTAGASTSGGGAAAALRSAADAARVLLGSGAGAAGARGAAGGAAWFAGGGNCLLARHGALLVEYDAAMRAPIGVVFMGIGVHCFLAAHPCDAALLPCRLHVLGTAELAPNIQSLAVNTNDAIAEGIEIVTRRAPQSLQ